MTRDEIVRIARQVGYPINHPDWAKAAEEFAALIAAAEREACAQLVQSRKTGANELMDAVRDMEAYAIRGRGQK